MSIVVCSRQRSCDLDISYLHGLGTKKQSKATSECEPHHKAIPFAFYVLRIEVLIVTIEVVQYTPSRSKTNTNSPHNCYSSE